MHRLMLIIATAIVWAPLALSQSANESVTVTAQMPTENVAGLPLTNPLQNFVLECGPSPGVYDGPAQSFSVGGQSTLEVQTDQLFSEGTWYCTARVTDTGGLSSARSGEVNFTVPPLCDRVDCSPAAPIILDISFGA